MLLLCTWIQARELCPISSGSRCCPFGRVGFSHDDGWHLRPPFSFCKKKMRRARWKRKTLFVLERDFRQKISVESLGAGAALLYLLARSPRRTFPNFPGAYRHPFLLFPLPLPWVSTQYHKTAAAPFNYFRRGVYVAKIPRPQPPWAAAPVTDVTGGGVVGRGACSPPTSHSISLISSQKSAALSVSRITRNAVSSPASVPISML